MAWTYRQRTGELLDAAGRLVAVGYSGKDDGDGVPEPGEGRNDPDAQHLRNIGPVPRGRWRFGAPFTHPSAGGYVLRLFPLEVPELHGRDGFLVHGDAARAPGTASKGCIIVPRWVRARMWESGDHELVVVRDAPSEPLAAAPVPDPEVVT